MHFMFSLRVLCAGFAMAVRYVLPWNIDAVRCVVEHVCLTCASPVPTHHGRPLRRAFLCNSGGARLQDERHSGNVSRSLQTTSLQWPFVLFGKGYSSGAQNIGPFGS